MPPYAGEMGMDEICKHDNFWLNCRECVMEKYEREGVRDDKGVLHASNGGNRDDAYCIGHIEKDPRWPDGDGRCTVLVRHCPVLNTPEELKANLHEDWDTQRRMAHEKYLRLRKEVEDAYEAWQEIKTKEPK